MRPQPDTTVAAPDRIPDTGNHPLHIQGRFRLRALRGRIQGKKSRADSPSFHFGEVDVGIGVIDTHIPSTVDLGRRIAVTVEDKHPYLVPYGARVDLRIREIRNSGVPL